MTSPDPVSHSDTVLGLESRALGYDGRDRLTTVTNTTTGNESYTYDPLDETGATAFQMQASWF